MKKEVRIIAWDDCGFGFAAKSVLVVGVVFRGGQFLDGLLSTYVKKDGLDATEKIAGAVNASRHRDQLSYMMLNGITFAGFNMVDMQKLMKKTGMPVVAVQRSRPDMKKFMQAMRKLKDYGKRGEMVKRAGKIHRYGKIFYQAAGMAKKECDELLKITCTRANVPEPLRVAHLIASGLSRKNKDSFESRGRA